MTQIIIIPLEFSRATNVKLGTSPILHLSGGRRGAGRGGGGGWCGPTSSLTLAQRRALIF